MATVEKSGLRRRPRTAKRRSAQMVVILCLDGTEGRTVYARDAVPSPRMPYKWRLVAMLWWISFFNYADRQAIFSVFPLLEREMHLTTVQLGLLGSGFAWVYGLGAPF